MAEGMANHVVGHHPGMPRLGHTQQTLVTAGSVVHALHDPIITHACGVLGDRDS
jgi:hypothetical protein